MTGLFFVIIIIAIALIALPIALTKNDSQQTPVHKKPQKTFEELLTEIKLAEVKRQAESAGDTATVQAVLDMNYKGQLPMEKPDGTYTSIYSDVISYSIAGINFRRGISKYVGEFMGYIEAEPKNKYDPNAIAIHASDGHHLGYIPADYTDDVRDLTRSAWPYPTWCEIEEDYDYDENRRYFRGNVYLEIHM